MQCEFCGRIYMDSDSFTKSGCANENPEHYQVDQRVEFTMRDREMREHVTLRGVITKVLRPVDHRPTELDLSEETVFSAMPGGFKHTLVVRIQSNHASSHEWHYLVRLDHGGASFPFRESEFVTHGQLRPIE
jgi:hypothetical protein